MYSRSPWLLAYHDFGRVPWFSAIAWFCITVVKTSVRYCEWCAISAFERSLVQAYKKAVYRETARCRCKIRYVLKFAAASRGSICDRTQARLLYDTRYSFVLFSFERWRHQSLSRCDACVQCTVVLYSEWVRWLSRPRTSKSTIIGIWGRFYRLKMTTDDISDGYQSTCKAYLNLYSVALPLYFAIA